MARDWRSRHAETPRLPARRVRACLNRRGHAVGGRPGQEAQDRGDLRLLRSPRRRRLRPARARREDHDRLLHQKGRRRGLPDRGDLRRRPEQARRRHQRGGPPDRAGKGRHAARLLLIGAVRAGGRPRRAAQEVHVHHHVHLVRRAREPESQVRLPRAAERPAVRPDVDGLHRRRTRRRSSARSRRTCVSPSSTRTAPTASTCRRATRPAPRRPASTWCCAKATRRRRPICRPW